MQAPLNETFRPSGENLSRLTTWLNWCARQEGTYGCTLHRLVATFGIHETLDESSELVGKSKSNSLPAVVAVLVACNPGSWFLETLNSLANQDYPALSVLILDNGSVDDLAPTIAKILPWAHLKRLTENRGFGAAANEALNMVEGASHLLICHDDVALAPNAVRVMLEESYRQNAGIVTPKFVAWEDEQQLLQVGLGVDWLGAAVNRVEEGEVDHGQHDAVREVFAAPGGCMLVRHDLFESIGGFDASMFLFGEDIDISWRARLAGARVVVAPSVKVRHLEALSTQARKLVITPTPDRYFAGAIDALPVDSRSMEDSTAALDTGEVDASTTGTVLAAEESTSMLTESLDESSLHMLAHRNELRTFFKNTGVFVLVAMLPALFVNEIVSIGRLIVRWDQRGLKELGSAWWWNVRNAGDLVRSRRAISKERTVNDLTVRRLMIKGSAQFAILFHQLIHRDVGMEGRERRSNRIAWITWVSVFLVWLLGSRQLLGGGQLPLFGGLAPLPSSTRMFMSFMDGYKPSVLSGVQPAPLGSFLLGLVGSLFLGKVSFLFKMILVLCVPIGALGAARLARIVVGRLAGLVAGVVYLAIPLPYDLLYKGQTEYLIAYALVPFVLYSFALLFKTDAITTHEGEQAITSRVNGSVPGTESNALLQVDPSAPEALSSVVEDSSGTSLPPGRKPHVQRLWSVKTVTRSSSSTDVLEPRAPRPLEVVRSFLRSEDFRMLIKVAMLEALLEAFAPVGLILGALVVVGLVLSSLFLGSFRQAARVLFLGVSATAASMVLSLPWWIADLSSSHPFSVSSGSTTLSSGMNDILRFHVGPWGGGVIGWMPLVAAGLVLMVGRGKRFVWGVRFWSIAVVAWLYAWASGLGLMGGARVPVDATLTVAAVSVAVCMALGAEAVVVDLPRYRLGWRQVALSVSSVAAVLAVLPFLSAASGGRWGMPSTGYRQLLSWMIPNNRSADFNVLWVGRPGSMPNNGFVSGQGIEYASTSARSLTNPFAFWPVLSPGQLKNAESSISSAQQGLTTEVGGLLRQIGVKYVVVTSHTAPVVSGLQSPRDLSAPPSLVNGLLQQRDITEVMNQAGVSVFKNLDWTSNGYTPSRSRSPVFPGEPLIIDVAAWLVAFMVLSPRMRQVLAWRSGIRTGRSHSKYRRGTLIAVTNSLR